MFAPQMIQAGLGVIQGVAGLIQRNKLKDRRPLMDVQPENQQNVLLAQNLKNKGLDQTSLNVAKQQIGRGAILGLQQLANKRGSTAGVGNLVRNMQDAGLSLAVKDAAMRQQNLVTGTQMEMGANQNLAQQKQVAWDWNQRQNWVTKMDEANANIGAGIRNVTGALGSAASMMQTDMMYNGSEGLNKSKEKWGAFINKFRPGSK